MKTLIIFSIVNIICISYVGAQQISGSGTTGYVPRFTTSTSISNSTIYQKGSTSNASIGIGTAQPNYRLDVNGSINASNMFCSDFGLSVLPFAKLHVNGQSMWLTNGNGAALSSSAGKGLRMYYDSTYVRNADYINDRKDD